MHEMALAHAVVDSIEDDATRHAFTRVERVVLEIGALSCVDPQALAFGFDAASRGTRAEGAALDILTPAGRARCFTCENEVTIARKGDPCPACGSHRLFVLEGEEMKIKSLEVV